jgi:outer membrane protein assembly factor BamB
MVSLEVEREKRDNGIASGGHLPDILSSDGQSIFMRSARFNLELVQQKGDVPHLWSSVGFLDDTWWHRSYWQIGTSMSSGWGGWAKAGQSAPAGRLLVTDGTRVFGFGRNQYDTPGAHVGVDADGVWGPIGREQGRWTYYELFGMTLDDEASKRERRGQAAPTMREKDWRRRVPVLGHALVLADETLFLAGPQDPLDEIPHQPAGVDPLALAHESDQGGQLLAFSAVSGETIGEYELPSPPVLDGMASADGRLYLATKAGGVVCLNGKRD